MRQILFFCLLSMCSGCSSIAYYAQSVKGQLQIIANSRPIDTLLVDDRLPAEVARKLARALEIREFASRELYLPDNDSYRYYADLDRQYVVWNVFATPALSLQAKEWCYLFVGCLGYRGYFSKSRADQFAGQLAQQGLDTWVGGVSAYSTLGWFTDPVLNTMLSREEDFLARIIFHELAHQKIYIKNDTGFNEAFAETVALEGLRRWYASHSDPASYRLFLTRLQHEDQFVSLVLQYRDQLEEVYRSNMSPGDKQLHKNRLLQSMVDDYRLMRALWGDDDRYDAWFASGLNNAKLSAVSTYRLYVPVLRNKLEQLGSDLRAFYTFIERLGQCSPEERKTYFENGGHETACLN